MKPIIGITASFGDDKVGVPYSYVKSVEEAGGVPVILPVIRDEALAPELLGALDGLLLSGGVDVDPQHFGQDPAPKLAAVSPERDFVELAVTRLALEKNVPILAICRGIQLLNVAAGGTLIQDIESEVDAPLKHRQQAPRYHASHRVTLEEDSMVRGMLKPDGDDMELWVNTYHHQALKTVAQGFRVTAEAPDGIIEAVESTEHDFVVGVQWHPEGMWDQHPHMLNLFKGFVEACGRRS